MEPLFFDGWPQIGRTLIIGFCGFVGIIIILRLSGKRTLAKFNAFDFVVTIAFGSILASMMMSSSTPLLQGLVSFGWLVFLQWVVTFIAARWDKFDEFMKADPRLVYLDGTFITSAMKKERIARSEIVDTIRDSSIGSLDLVHAVVLESDGTLSVIPKEKEGDGSCIPESKANL